MRHIAVAPIRDTAVKEDRTLLPLVASDAPALTLPARRVTEFDDELGALITALFARLLADGWPALAAPHLGVELRVIAYSLDDHQGYIVNPVVEHTDGDAAGTDVCPCLTDPEVIHISSRPTTIVISGVDAENRPTLLRAVGHGAHALHHELDHLDGRTHPRPQT